MKAVNKVLGIGLLGFAVAVSVAFAPRPATAAYPDRPVRMIVPFPAGGGTDGVARLIGKSLSERLGQNVVVENRAGASGGIGMSHAKNAKADGYTLIFGADSNFTILALVRKKVDFDIKKDFEPISFVARIPYALMVHPSVKVKTMADLVTFAKANPGMFTVAVPGVGTGLHLTLAAINAKMGINLKQINYKGTRLATPDVVAGRVNMLILGVAGAGKLAKAGKLRPVAVTSADRSNVFPQIPTLMQAGVPDTAIDAWWGVMGPKGIPAPIVKRLESEFSAIMKNPKISGRLGKIGIVTVGGSADMLTKEIDSATRKFGVIVDGLGLRNSM